jgi:pimeloyl-ACP methyl ester carboxylesterase
MSTAATKAMGATLNAIGVVAPQRAGQLAFDLFCKPPGARHRTATETRALETLSANMTTADVQRVATRDGEVQTYLWRTSVTPSRGRVLLVHGWTSEARIMTLFVTPLLRAGYDVAALDLPAHGLSSGKRLNMPIGARAVLAVGDVLGPFSGVIGHSFGGLVTALAAEGGAPLDRALPVDRLVLISTPHSLTRLTEEFGVKFGFTAATTLGLQNEVTRAAGRSVHDITTGGMLKAAGVPALILHDDEDDVVPPSDGTIVAAMAGATLQTTKGLGHRRIIVMPTTVRASIRFLNGETA